MAKTTKNSKVKEDKKDIIQQVKKSTLCYLASKANHIIEVQLNGQTTFIQPFGKIKVVKEQIKINSDDARYLTFIKI